MLRAGTVDVALVFRHDDAEPEAAGIRLLHLLDDPIYLLSKDRVRGLGALRGATWIAGCERVRATCCRCAPLRVSSPRSATPPTTWW